MNTEKQLSGLAVWSLETFSRAVNKVLRAKKIKIKKVTIGGLAVGGKGLMLEQTNLSRSFAAKELVKSGGIW